MTTPYDHLSRYLLERVSLHEDELRLALSHYRPLSLKKNDVVLQKGQISQRMFFVCSGCLRAFFDQHDGQEVTHYLAFERHFISGLMSFISQQPSQEWIQAIEPSEVLYITHDDFHSLLEKIPAWEKFYRHYLENAYTINTGRLMSFLTTDATERYRHLLQKAPEIVLRLPNHMVASYLNLSQETLSRIKSRL